MALITHYFLPCLYAFIACLGFSLLFNIHGKGILICSLGGALGWLVYLLAEPVFHNDIAQALVAALALSAFSEGMARLRKCPVTAYVLVSAFPLVPGAGIYYTMEHAVNGEMDLFLSTGMHTLGLAGALALGILMMASAVRMWNSYHRRRRLRKGESA